MSKENMFIEDESGDRKYFTMLPNYILNHSTAIDQALYMQMKRYAGENGECFASKNTLIEKLGIGKKALNKSIAYLLKRNWIYEKGFKLVDTKGGKQKITVFGVKDIWKMNVEHYEKQGSAESTPLEGGLQSNARVVPEVTQGGLQRASNKNHSNKNHKEEEVVAIATTPKNQSLSFFLMVKENGERYSSYLASINAPEEFARREIGKFVDYWTELNKSGTRQKWEMENTFEVIKRLKSWLNRAKDFKQNNFTNKYQATKIF